MILVCRTERAAETTVVVMELPSYRYESLDGPGQIRLVTILPQERGPAIRLTIEHVDMESQPKYECLSYAWGTDDPDRVVTIGDSSFMVTTTLHVALEHLRHVSQERKIWIDAICINQTDIAERSSQVAIMRDIYRTATRVVVWLGPATESSEQAMAFLNMLAGARKNRSWYVFRRDRGLSSHTSSEHRAKPANSTTWWESLKSCLIRVYASVRWRVSQDRKLYKKLRPDPSLLREYIEAVATAETTKNDFAVTGYPCLYYMNGNPYEDYFKNEWEPYWQDLDELLARPWWNRTWIVQEVWCASDAVVQCGSTSIEWKTLQMAMDYSEAWDDIGYHLEGMKRESQWDTLRQRYTLAIHLTKARVNGSSLSSLLWNTWDRASTDPRDKVFVVLGLVGDAQGVTVAPDYRKSMERVYQETAHHIIEKEGHMDILLAASGIHDDDGLPSWVPDWRREAYAKKPVLLVNRHLLMKLCYSGSTDMVVLQGHGYRAAGNSEAFASFSEDLRVLTVLGRKLDSIAEVWDAEIAAMSDDEFTNQAFDFILRSKFVSAEVQRKVSAEREQAPNSRNGSILLTTLTGGGNVRHDKWGPTMRNIMRQRRLFVTKNGHVGIGSVRTQPRDAVFIISGCNFPIVLRPRGGNFAVVGEAYVHGYMAGEALARPWYTRWMRLWDKISII
jgi:hypothetical protein